MTILIKATSPEISVEDLGAGFSRADIEFHGVDHSGSSYEGRVYVNNPDADGDTDTTEENGYAGSYYIFGHGGCYFDEGHCDVQPRGPYDPRPPHELWPTRKVVIATDAIRRAAEAGSSLTVTVVPVLCATSDKVPEDEELPKFEMVSVITYQ
jgi:tyrosinase